MDKRKYIGRAGGMFHDASSDCPEKPSGEGGSAIYSDSAHLLIVQGMFPCPLCLDKLIPRVSELKNKIPHTETYELG